MLYLEGESNFRDIISDLQCIPAARIEENFFIFVEVVTLIFVPHMGEVVKHPQVGSIEGVKSAPGWKLADFKGKPCDKGCLFNTTRSYVCLFGATNSIFGR